jgi:threonine/homoserine/homoserine lactone efflux protein
LRASQTAFYAVKFAGAAYLVYLGVRALVAAARGERDTDAHGRQHGARMPARIAYRQGLLSNLGNPKMAVFFISLLPQFASPHGSSFVAILVLGFVFSTLTLTRLSGYAFVVAKLGDVLRRRRVRRMLDAITGVALVDLGVRLASERREPPHLRCPGPVTAVQPRRSQPRPGRLRTRLKELEMRWTVKPSPRSASLRRSPSGRRPSHP